MAVAVPLLRQRYRRRLAAHLSPVVVIVVVGDAAAAPSFARWRVESWHKHACPEKSGPRRRMRTAPETRTLRRFRDRCADGALFKWSFPLKISHQTLMTFQTLRHSTIFSSLVTFTLRLSVWIKVCVNLKLRRNYAKAKKFPWCRIISPLAGYIKKCKISIVTVSEPKTNAARIQIHIYSLSPFLVCQPGVALLVSSTTLIEIFVLSRLPWKHSVSSTCWLFVLLSS